MDHRLRPIVRVDGEMRTAVVELHGCLTVPATSALLRILAKARSLNQQLNLSLDLRHARHIEPDSLTALRLPGQTATSAAATPGAGELNAVLEHVGPVKVLLPPVWPACPVDKAFAGSRVREAGQP